MYSYFTTVPYTAFGYGATSSSSETYAGTGQTGNTFRSSSLHRATYNADGYTVINEYANLRIDVGRTDGGSRTESYGNTGLNATKFISATLTYTHAGVTNTSASGTQSEISSGGTYFGTSNSDTTIVNTNTYSESIPSTTTATVFYNKKTTTQTGSYGYIISTTDSNNQITSSSSSSSYDITTITTGELTVKVGTSVSTSSYSPYLIGKKYESSPWWNYGPIAYISTVSPQTLYKYSDLQINSVATELTPFFTAKKTSPTITDWKAGSTYTGTAVYLGVGTITAVDTVYTQVPVDIYYYSSTAVETETTLNDNEFITSTAIVTAVEAVTTDLVFTFNGPTSTRISYYGKHVSTTKFALTGLFNDPTTLSDCSVVTFSSYPQTYYLNAVITNSASGVGVFLESTSSSYFFSVAGEEEDVQTSTLKYISLLFDNSSFVSFVRQQHARAGLVTAVYIPATQNKTNNSGFLKITNSLGFDMAGYNYLSYGPEYNNSGGILNNFRSSGNISYSYFYNLGKFFSFDNFGRAVTPISQSSYSFLYQPDTNETTYRTITLSHSSLETFYYTLKTEESTQTESTFQFQYDTPQTEVYTSIANTILFGPLQNQIQIGGGVQPLYTAIGSFVDSPQEAQRLDFTTPTTGPLSRTFAFTKITDESNGTLSGTTCYTAHSSHSVTLLEAYQPLNDGWQLTPITDGTYGPFPSELNSFSAYGWLGLPSFYDGWQRTSSFALKTSGYYSSAFTTFR